MLKSMEQYFPILTVIILMFGVYLLWRTSERFQRRKFVKAIRLLAKTDRWKAEQIYLASKWWAETRQRAFVHFGSRCAGCNTPFGLQGHHRTYDNLGDEKLGDVVPFCGSCHSRLPTSNGLYRN